MTDALVWRPSRRLVLTLGVGLFGCAMDNPAFDLARDEVGDTAEGDGDGDDDPSGDGDGDGEPTTGDGDGEPTTGDGDGEPTTGDGDGDGDGDAESSTGDGDGDGDDPNTCLPGQDMCDGSCVDLKFDDANCGMCGYPCEAGEICGEGFCRIKKYVFVTSETMVGEFGGPTVAKSLCNELAAAVDLPGTYSPWLSTQNIYPAQIIAPINAAYVLRNGPVIAWTWPEFQSGQHLAAINHNQYGDAIAPSPACEIEYAVWTGTSDTGLPVAPNCNGWLSTETLGLVGNAQTDGPGWSASDCHAACDLKLPFYCVQE